jgi:hypothetical protein
MPAPTFGAGEAPGAGVGVATGVGLAQPATRAAASAIAAIMRTVAFFEYIVFVFLPFLNDCYGEI